MQSAKAPAGSRFQPWLAGGALFLLGLACYAPALNGGFVWDDQAHVTRADLRPLSGLWRIWFEPGATQQYYPLLHSAFWLEHRLWGDAPLGYHLLNVGLHVLAACLAATLLKRLAIPGAWLAATLFVVHPVCVESVAWISEQKNTLSLVFYLASALAYIRFDGTRRPAPYFEALGLFALALLTKSVTATLPAALLVILWWKRGRLDWKRDAAPLAPWFAVGAASGLFTALVERRLIGAEGSEYALSALQRCLLAGRILWFYLGKLVLPTDLSFFYPHWNVAAAGARWTVFLAATAAVTAALWLARRRSRGPLAAWLFYGGSLFPALGFINIYPFRYSYVADHFQYLASLGVIALCAAGAASRLGRLGGVARLAGWTACIFLVGLLGLMTLRQSGTYRDLWTLYAATIERNPGSWIAHNNLGVELSRIDSRRPEALAHFEEAVRLNPNFSEAQFNLAEELANMPGRMPEAAAHYEEVLRIDPNDARAHYKLANALARIPGREPEALAHYESSLRLNPNNAEAQNNLAVYYAGTGRLDEAIAHLEIAVRLNPAYDEARKNLDTLRSMRR